MKSLSITAVACTVVAVSGLAVAKTPSASTGMKLTLSGDGRWSVLCTLEVGNGIIDREEFKGGKAGPVVFSTANLKHGSCDYKAAPGKLLTIAVEGEAWACPLTAPTDGKCEQAMSPGASGSLRLRLRGEK